MRVIIEHQQLRIPLDISPSEIISEIKEKVYVELKLSVNRFSFALNHNGTVAVLDDSKELSSYNIPDNGTLIVFLQKLKRQISYLESLGFNENLPSRNSDPLQVVMEACKAGSLKDFTRILQIFEKTNPGEEDLMNQCHPSLWRPLHYASYYGRHEIVKFLVSRNVNVNRVTLDQWTPLQLASYQSHMDCVHELLQHSNLQINKMTYFRGTALHLACEVGNPELVRLLLDNGAMVSLKDPSDQSVFEKTVNESILEMLAVAMGVEELKKHKNQPPVSKVSEVVMSSSLSIYGRNVVLHLDPQNRQFSRYSSMDIFSARGDPEFAIRLHDVQNVSVQESPAAREYYFIVESSRSSEKYSCKDSRTANEWMLELKNAANYFMLETPIKEEAVMKQEVVKAREDVEESQTIASDTVAEVINFESFELIEELGHGSFGVVYRAKKNNTGEIFAMKCLNKTALKRSRQLKYAISECKIMKIMKNPFVLSMHYAFQTAQSLYMVLELCPNGDLLGLILKYSKLPEDTARFYTAETILALEYLHSLDIVYRDLKPANILIDSEGHAKLADFGLAKEDIKNTPAMTMAGSPAYLPPEIVDRKGASTASDVYGLGVMLYELLTGNLPYYNQDIELLFNSIKKDKFSFPNFVSADAKGIITALMQKNPEKRLTIPQIKKHAFFKKIDWEELALKRISVPVLN